MATKTLTIQTTHAFTSRGETETVAEALKWLDDHMSTENEEGESEGPAYSPGDLIVYAVRRLRALHKDGKRYNSGKLASRLYAPRLDNLSEKVHAPKPLVQAVETIDATQEKLNPSEPKKAPAKKTEKAPKGSPARGAQVKAKHEAKQARKAAKVESAKGGATVKF